MGTVMNSSPKPTTAPERRQVVHQRHPPRGAESTALSIYAGTMPDDPATARLRRAAAISRYLGPTLVGTAGLIWVYNVKLLLG